MKIIKRIESLGLTEPEFAALLASLENVGDRAMAHMLEEQLCVGWAKAVRADFGNVARWPGLDVASELAAIAAQITFTARPTTARPGDFSSGLFADAVRFCRTSHAPTRCRRLWYGTALSDCRCYLGTLNT
jgi:hypothetical protein